MNNNGMNNNGMTNYQEQLARVQQRNDQRQQQQTVGGMTYPQNNNMTGQQGYNDMQQNGQQVMMNQGNMNGQVQGYPQQQNYGQQVQSYPQQQQMGYPQQQQMMNPMGNGNMMTPEQMAYMRQQQQQQQMAYQANQMRNPMMNQTQQMGGVNQNNQMANIFQNGNNMNANIPNNEPNTSMANSKYNNTARVNKAVPPKYDAHANGIPQQNLNTEFQVNTPVSPVPPVQANKVKTLPADREEIPNDENDAILIKSEIKPEPDSEFMTLVLPIYYNLRIIHNDIYRYKVMEKENMNYDEHIKCYKRDEVINKVKNVNAVPTLRLEHKKLTGNLTKLLSDMVYYGCENLKSSGDKNLQMIGYNIAEIPYVKEDNGSVAMVFHDLVTKSKDLLGLRDLLETLLDTTDFVKKSAIQTIDGLLTYRIISYVRAAIASDITIDSFIGDYKELMKGIDGKNFDELRRNVHKNAFRDIFNTLKSDVKAIPEILKVNPPKEARKVGNIIVPASLNIIYTIDQNIIYELSSIRKGKIMYVREDMTPVLYSLISKSNKESVISTTATILVINNSLRYRIIRSKIRGSFTIEQI